MIPGHCSEKKPNRLIIMSKAPIAGQCKTRLAPRLGLRGAARLQHQLIMQRLRLAQDYDGPVEIHASPDLRHPVFLRAKRMGYTGRKQCSGPLGRRMRRAQGREAAIIIGTDCPSLGPAHIAQVRQELQRENAVCIPASDGGYVLIALPRAAPILFQSIRWGSDAVLRQTRRQQRRSALNWVTTSALDDLDTPADYRQQRRRDLLDAF